MTLSVALLLIFLVGFLIFFIGWITDIQGIKFMIFGLSIILVGGIIILDDSTRLAGVEYLIMIFGLIFAVVGLSKKN
ncbi:MAG: hypothetical protein ACQEV7_17350 [Bacillota bacterium]